MKDQNLSGIGMTSQRTRQRMIDRLMQQGISNRQVLDAMMQTPRHIFVEEAFQSRAYEDLALSIGFEQTISKPFTVALMCQLMMEVNPQKVLEVGTGCGYQAHVMSLLVPKVYSIERIEGLFNKAKENLKALNSRAHLRYGDGFKGITVQAPFDAILLAASPTLIPQTLLDQLSPQGVLIAPEGGKGHSQVLVRYSRQGSGFAREEVAEAEFVPMLRGLE